jgi:NTP pyrophosphatase (non-canonical NTP hydrolase)
MTLKEYDDYVDSRCKAYVNPSYCVIALNGEAGEVAEWFKKYELRGNPVGDLSTEDLLGELGDVQFYLTRLAHEYGFTLEDVMQYNRAKLDNRVKQELM